MDAIKSASWLSKEKLPALLAAGLIFARLLALLTLTLEGLRGYGDFPNFFRVSGLPGWPFLNYWVEFPPLFPFLNALLHRLASGQEHTYDYLLALILLLADAGSLYLLTRLVLRLFPTESALLRAGAYLVVLASLAYTWWYFDPLPVFLLLLSLTLVLDGRVYQAGGAAALGILAKFFPGLALLAAWGRTTWKRLALLVLTTLLPVILAFGLLWLRSPDFTTASIVAQGSKGSWESIWALLDGNLRTGNFGALEERLDPAMASVNSGSPAVIPAWASLLVFGGVGLWVLAKHQPRDDHQSLALVGFALCLLLLWSPGWSPQWVLYLLPLILLVLPERQAFLLGAVLIFINLLEWPVMLSRGYFWGLYLSISLRTFVLLILCGTFLGELRLGKQPVQTAVDGMV